MKKFLTLFFLSAIAMYVGCAQTRSAQTGLGQSIDNATTVTFDWGEVYCGKGVVCSEVEVRRVDIESRDGGKVEVTLHNRTNSQVAVQIALEILAANGSRLDSTQYYDVPIQPRVEKVWTMPGIYRTGAKVRVLLRRL